MSIEICRLCNEEATPWYAVKGGHICDACYYDIKQDTSISWVSIHKTLPLHKWVLLSNGEVIWIGQIDNHLNKQFYCKCCLENLETVKYWMPLPELPE